MSYNNNCRAYLFEFLLFGFKVSLGLVIMRLLLDDILEALRDRIFCSHVTLHMLNLFENGLFVVLIVFVQLVIVALDAMLYQIENFIGHTISD